MECSRVWIKFLAVEVQRHCTCSQSPFGLVQLQRAVSFSVILHVYLGVLWSLLELTSCSKLLLFELNTVACIVPRAFLQYLGWLEGQVLGVDRETLLEQRVCLWELSFDILCETRLPGSVFFPPKVERKPTPTAQRISCERHTNCLSVGFQAVKFSSLTPSSFPIRAALRLRD